MGLSDRTLRLRVVCRIPVGIVDHHLVGGCDVKTHPAGPRADKEYIAARVRVELVDCGTGRKAPGVTKLSNLN